MTPQYWAGLFDGEGCVLISFGRGRYHQMVVEIQMTDKEPMYLIQSQYGGSVKIKDNSKRNNRKTTYHWTITSSAAVPFLESILPYSIVKRQQIIVALDFQSRMFPGSHTRWEQLDEEEIEIRQKFRLKLQELKK